MAVKKKKLGEVAVVKIALMSCQRPRYGPAAVLFTVFSFGFHALASRGHSDVE